MSAAMPGGDASMAALCSFQKVDMPLSKEAMTRKIHCCVAFYLARVPVEAY
jgi:hypothetical protein